ncbi:hypothetical protein HPB50_012310 [Hyalomma asiaticum]|uniref:Uncharacterized protein n=1 Tax=Hyalomma asiaticum TaxID=266040 RepID=A0ACB7TLI3_HYAAI|nr:hypothetical protein HPB50_012310 [Hyalomma asiaticum]
MARGVFSHLTYDDTSDNPQDNLRMSCTRHDRCIRTQPSRPFRPSLCGRDLITALSKRGVPFEQLTAPELPAAPISATYRVNNLLAEFEEVSSADLGFIKAVQLKVPYKLFRGLVISDVLNQPRFRSAP